MNWKGQRKVAALVLDPKGSSLRARSVLWEVKLTQASQVLNSGLTIGAILDRSAKLCGGKVAIVDGQRQSTYRDLNSDANKLAGGLASRGIGKGHRIAIWLPNCLEWAIAFFGIAKLGAVAVPINPALSPTEVQYLVEQSGSVALIVPREFRSRDYIADSLRIRSSSSRAFEVIVVGGGAPTGMISWEAVVEGGRDHGPLEGVSPDDPTVILYTSGTTGLPKGAVHSHRFLPVLMSAARRLRLTAEDRVILYLPLFHVYGLMVGLVAMLSVGAEIVLMRRFQGGESLSLMEAKRATIVFGVPSTYIDQLAELHSVRRDLSAIRLACVQYPVDLGLRVSAQFGFCVNSYGMTETSAMAFTSSVDEPQDIAISTVGLPLDGIEAKIVDETTSQPVAPGVAGLLLLRGPSILLRYHDKPEETSRAFTEDGWFRTGDIASLDSGGRLTFIGRRGEQFRVGGEIVDPVEVETTLQRHPAVERAAVVGIEDERLGQVGCAWVKLHEGAHIASDELAEFVSAKLARFKRPCRIFIVETFPTTASGKVQKFRLLEQLRASRKAP